MADVVRRSVFGSHTGTVTLEDAEEAGMEPVDARIANDVYESLYGDTFLGNDARTVRVTTDRIVSAVALAGDTSRRGIPYTDAPLDEDVSQTEAVLNAANGALALPSNVLSTMARVFGRMNKVGYVMATPEWMHSLPCPVGEATADSALGPMRDSVLRQVCALRAAGVTLRVDGVGAEFVPSPKILDEHARALLDANNGALRHSLNALLAANARDLRLVVRLNGALVLDGYATHLVRSPPFLRTMGNYEVSMLQASIGACGGTLRGVICVFS